MNVIKKKKFIIYNTDNSLKTAFDFVGFVEKIRIKASQIIGKINTQDINLKTDNNQYIEIDIDKTEETEINLTIYGTVNNYAVCVIQFEVEEKQARKHFFKIYNFKKNKKRIR